MTPGSESSTASLAAKGLDVLSMAMGAIPNQGVDVSVYNPEVWTLVVRTGEAICVYPLGSPPAAFDLALGADRWRHRLSTR